MAPSPSVRSGNSAGSRVSYFVLSNFGMCPIRAIGQTKHTILIEMSLGSRRRQRRRQLPASGSAVPGHAAARGKGHRQDPARRKTLPHALGRQAPPRSGRAQAPAAVQPARLQPHREGPRGRRHSTYGDGKTHYYGWVTFAELDDAVDCRFRWDGRR